MQPRISAATRRSVFAPSIAAKKSAVTARYQDVTTQISTGFSPSSALAETV